MERGTFKLNQAASGGAIYYAFTNNTPTPLTSSLTVKQSSFETNSPPAMIVGAGGAIETEVDIDAGTVAVSITTSTFSGNGIANARGRNGIATTGGGVDIHQNTSGNGSASTTFTNDTFFQNTADGNGGGAALFLANTGSGTNTAALTNLTVYQNTAGVDSGGLYVSAAQAGAVSVNNSILSGNTVTAANYQGPVDVTLTNNNALTDKGYNLVGTTDTMFTAVTNRITNVPGLPNALAANGALSGYLGQTLALQNNSPALKTGDPKQAGQIDERGYTRLKGNVSIGAYDPGAQALKQGQSSTSITSSNNPALVGQPITFTATVAGGGGNPTGTVTFYDGTTVLGTSTLDANDNATLTTSALALGSHTITATYNGDSNFSGSSGSLTQIISGETNSSLSLSSSLNPAAPT